MLAQLGVLEDVVGGAVEHDFAHIEDDRAVGKVQGGDRVLLDDNGGEAELFDFLQDSFDFLDDHRGQAFVRLVEEEQLAGNVGAASARAMISQVTTGEHISLDALMRIADETQQVIEYSHELQQKTDELEETADQLRIANERLRQLDLQKDDFLSTVSHEVRTPLASIRSFSEILADSEELELAQSRRFADIIRGESERMTRLLDDILDLNLLERGETRFRLERMDAESVLERAIETSVGIATKAGVRLHSAERVKNAIVEADPDRLSQVFMNLLSNAIKYNSSADPGVQVQSLIDDRHYQVIVKDNGPGIDPLDRDRIFEKFSRGWSQTSSDRSGAGLALAISWQIMNSLRGSLKLLPDHEKGAAFVVSLPIIEGSRTVM